jgi:outer membrane protein TolC
MIAVPKASLPEPYPIAGQSTAAATVALSSPSLAPPAAGDDLPSVFPTAMQPTPESAWFGFDASSRAAVNLAGINSAQQQKAAARRKAAKKRAAAAAEHDESAVSGGDASSNPVAEDSKDLDADDEASVETFVAFARVFSGVLRPDSPVFVLGPKYDVSH